MEYRWYAIQTTAGHENKVRNLLQKRIEDDPRPADTKLIRQALVPVQEVIEIKNGKKVNVERKLYPGYVLVEMGMSQEALHVVNSIQGVIKFVGTGKLPQPLRQDEVNRLLGIAEAVNEAEPKEEIPFMIGQVVEITEGPFSDFSGTVEEVLGRQGQGAGDGEPVRAADGGGVGLPAVEGALGVGSHGSGQSLPTARLITAYSKLPLPATARVIAAGLDAPQRPPIRGARWQKRSRQS